MPFTVCMYYLALSPIRTHTQGIVVILFGVSAFFLFIAGELVEVASICINAPEGCQTRHTQKWDILHTRHLPESTHTNTSIYHIPLVCVPCGHPSGALVYAYQTYGKY